VVFPTVAPALLTGFALAFRPGRRRVRIGGLHFGQHAHEDGDRPLLIITKLEQYDYAGAPRWPLVMLVVSFVLLLGINLLQWAARRRAAA